MDSQKSRKYYSHLHSQTGCNTKPLPPMLLSDSTLWKICGTLSFTNDNFILLLSGVLLPKVPVLSVYIGVWRMLESFGLKMSLRPNQNKTKLRLNLHCLRNPNKVINIPLNACHHLHNIYFFLAWFS